MGLRSRRSLLKQAGAASLAVGLAPFVHGEAVAMDYSKSLPDGASLLLSNGEPVGAPETLKLNPGDKITVTATVVVEPPPPPPPVAGGFDMGIDWPNLPLTGTAYSRVLALSKGTGQLDQSSIDCPNTNVLLANAALFRRTGQASYRDKVIAMLKADKPFSLGAHEPALQLGRNMAPRAIAAAWVGYTDAAYLKHLGDLRTIDSSGGGGKGTMVKTHEGRANNFGTCSGMSRIAIDLLIGDTTDLARALKVHRGWLGDRDQFVFPSTAFGDLLWQSDKAHPLGINPRGAKIGTADVDGVLPDDQRRSGGGTPSAPAKQNYVDQALGEVLITTALLGVFAYGDEGVRRAYGWLKRRSYPPVGDDRWQPVMANRLLGAGTSLSASGTQDGKSFGLTDWLYA